MAVEGVIEVTFTTLVVKQDGHTQDNYYSLHGFPYKIAKVSQSPNPAIEQKIKSEGNHLSLFSANEYKEYLQLKEAYSLY